MISPNFMRSELADRFGVKGKDMTQRINELKQFGKLIQRRVSAVPMTKKKKVVFNFVATNLQLEV